MRTASLSLLAWLGLVVLPAVSVSGAVTVNIPVLYDLLPNTAGQAVPILVSGGDDVTGVDVYFEIVHDANPYPRISPLAVGTAPVFTNEADSANLGVNLIGLAPPPFVSPGDDPIFNGNNTDQANNDFTDDFWYVTTSTSANTVAADGTLLYATFDTTGIFAAVTDLVWDLRMNDIPRPGFVDPFTTQFADSVGSPFFPDFTGGSVRIRGTQPSEVPEPSALAIWSLLGIGCCVGARRFRRRHS